MATPSLTTLTFAADDGAPLTYHQLGTGRPVVLLHGYMLPALPTWVDTGIAERLAAGGNRVTFEPGTSEADLEGYLQQLGADPAALIRVLDTFVDTARQALARVAVPTLVISGDQDNDRGSVEDLARDGPSASSPTRP